MRPRRQGWALSRQAEVLTAPALGAGHVLEDAQVGKRRGTAQHRPLEHELEN